LAHDASQVSAASIYQDFRTLFLRPVSGYYFFMSQKIFLSSPRGFCAGVKRAIQIVEICLQKFGSPIFVNHEIVHNKFVVESFKKKGVIFCDDFKKIIKTKTTKKVPIIFSAHGVNPKFYNECLKYQDYIDIVDATCPLVKNVHFQIQKLAKKDFCIFYIGKKNHQEFLGISGLSPNIFLIENIEQAKKIDNKKFEEKKCAVFTQTTLSMDDTEKILEILKKKLINLKISKNICYATQNRQNSIKKIAKQVDFVIVIGSKNSSNSNQLVSVAKKFCPAALYENIEFIPKKIFDYKKIGITSGASVPDVLVQEVIKKFKEKNPKLIIEEMKFLEERINFSIDNNFF